MGEGIFVTALVLFKSDIRTPMHTHTHERSRNRILFSQSFSSCRHIYFSPSIPGSPKVMMHDVPKKKNDVSFIFFRLLLWFRVEIVNTLFFSSTSRQSFLLFLFPVKIIFLSDWLTRRCQSVDGISLKTLVGMKLGSRLDIEVVRYMWLIEN